jgi:hypothetical protein
VPQSGLGTSGTEGVAPVGRAIVGHHPFDDGAVSGEPIKRAFEEGDGALFAFVWQDFGVPIWGAISVTILLSVREIPLNQAQNQWPQP